MAAAGKSGRVSIGPARYKAAWLCAYSRAVGSALRQKMPDRAIHALGMRHRAHGAKIRERQHSGLWQHLTQQPRNAEGRCRRTPADPVKNGHAQGAKCIQRRGICEPGTGPTTDVDHGSGHQPLPRRNGRVTRINGLGRSRGSLAYGIDGRSGQPSAQLQRRRNGRSGQMGHPPWQTPSRAASLHRPVTPPGSPARPAPFQHPADRAPAHGTAATAGPSGCAIAPRCLH